MKIKKIIFQLIVVSSSAIIMWSCIEDNITPPLTGELDTAAEMIVYFESQGDFANSNLAPALIDANDIYANLNSYLIVDIRSNDEFINGHIENAINIAIDTLYNFVETNYNAGYDKIIIVSKNGQSSAYFTCLLRLAGFNNVFSLNYGMATWNLVFADEWLNAIGDAPGANSFTNITFEKNQFTSLPKILFANPEAPIEERAKTRIKEIISAGFARNIVFTTVLNMKLYLVCYGNGSLYNARSIGPFAERGHPDGAVSYLDATFFDFRSIHSLQTLPNSQPILIYDYHGQIGACMTAYLRVIGYDVQFLLFGANSLFHSRMTFEPNLLSFAFTESLINNFPYETGQ